jgi:hypothetical protein
MKAKLDVEKSGRKKRRLTKKDNDVGMPIYDMACNIMVAGDVVGI